MTDANTIQLIDANTICLIDANTIALGTAVQAGGAGLPLERKKRSRKEKKRDDRAERERLALARELIRQAEEAAKALEAEQEQQEEEPVASPVKAKVIPPVEIKLRAFTPDDRLSRGLIEPGDASGFLSDALKREQARKELIRQTELSERILEEKRLQILADDEEVIALYLQQRQELIQAFLVTR